MTIASLRKSVETAVKASSLRAVADDVGMSWSGLRSFLEGTNPQPATIAKLISWRKDLTASGPTPEPGDLLALLEVLADYIEGARSPEGRVRRLHSSLELLAERLGLETGKALMVMLKRGGG